MNMKTAFDLMVACAAGVILSLGIQVGVRCMVGSNKGDDAATATKRFTHERIPLGISASTVHVIVDHKTRRELVVVQLGGVSVLLESNPVD